MKSIFLVVILLFTYLFSPAQSINKGQYIFNDSIDYTIRNFLSRKCFDCETKYQLCGGKLYVYVIAYKTKSVNLSNRLNNSAELNAKLIYHEALRASSLIARITFTYYVCSSKDAEKCTFFSSFEYNIPGQTQCINTLYF